MSTTEQASPGIDRDGYPANAVWRCEGYWFAPCRSWGVLGHRSMPGSTAVLGPRLLRLLAGDLVALADDLEAGETETPAVSDEAVAAALAAVPGYQRQAREAVWLYPSQGQARAMLEAAAPLIRADAEAKLAAVTDACRSIPTPIAERILAIIGSEEEAGDGR